jgi:hypothetical protein
MSTNPTKSKFDIFIYNLTKKNWNEYPSLIGDALRDLNDYSKTSDIFLPSFLVFLIVFMIIVGYIIFFYNPYKILDYANIPMIFIYIILFSYILFFTFRKFNDDEKYYNLQFEIKSYTSNYFKVLLLIFSLFIAFYILYNLAISLFLTSINISTTFTIISLVIVLAIINSYTGIYKTGTGTPILDFLKNLIFYIPCLISDFIDFMKEDYKNTPTTVFILFVILILISFIYLVTYFLKFKNNESNIVIVGNPVYLNSNIESLSKNELNEKIVNSKPFYERALYTLQEQKTVKYDLSFNNSDTIDAIDAMPAYLDGLTRAIYKSKEGFTSVMTDETFPIHFTIDDYDKYILQQAMWSNPEINNNIKNKDANNGDIGKYINGIIKQQKKLMSYYEKSMLYLATFNNSNFSKNFVKDLSNNNYIYSLSFWIYLNPTSTMKGKDIIIQYGNRPSMYFNHDKNELTLEIINQPDNTQVVLYRSSNILYQRWNHIVINNNYGEVDLFINSNLVGNYKNTVSYSITKDELLQVGSTNNNDIGGIAYMDYHEAPLSIKDISNKYINKPSF